jgi:hypothetical protein
MLVTGNNSSPWFSSQSDFPQLSQRKTYGKKAAPVDLTWQILKE